MLARYQLFRGCIPDLVDLAMEESMEMTTEVLCKLSNSQQILIEWP